MPEATVSLKQPNPGRREPQQSERTTWRKPALFALLGSILLVVLFFGIYRVSQLRNRGQERSSPSVPTAPNGQQLLPEGKNKATITVDSNPLKVCDGSALVLTTVSYTFPEGKLVEVRIGSPTVRSCPASS